MHEMSLAEGIVQIIENSAIEQQFSRVKAIWVEVGRLSHVEPEALSFCFDAVSRNTLAENAQLHLRVVDGKGFCCECGQIFKYNRLYDPCPHCDSFVIEVRGGNQMQIKELEVE